MRYPCNILEFCLMFLLKKFIPSNKQKFGLATLAASSAALLALATPAAANPLTFSRKLIAPDGASGDNFGHSIALDGNYALISAPGDDDNGTESGSAYLFDTTTGDFLQKLIAPDGASDDNFGQSLALDGDYALIGSYLDDNDNGTDSGSAYLFDTTTGNFLQKLTAPDGAISESFGYSVALDGNYALIGSYYYNEGNGSSSAYLFDITTGDLLQKLTAPDDAHYDYFGQSVAIDGDYALIGASHEGDAIGSAHLFDTTTGNLLQTYSGNNLKFGSSVALEGDSALIGSPSEGIWNGSAYLFSTTTGNLLQRFCCGSNWSAFSHSVALDGNYALIGTDAQYRGEAYLFDTSTGDLVQRIVPPDGDDFDYFYYPIDHSFGKSVALDGNSVLIGFTYSDGNVTNSGSAYLFTLETEKVPEPSAVLGLIAIGTLAAFKRSSRQQKQ